MLSPPSLGWDELPFSFLCSHASVVTVTNVCFSLPRLKVGPLDIACPRLIRCFSGMLKGLFFVYGITSFLLYELLKKSIEDESCCGPFSGMLMA